VHKGCEAERDGAHEEQAAEDFAGTKLVTEGAGNKSDQESWGVLVFRGLN
jgi:hypothetical protein